METDLIKTLEKFGVSITVDDVPEVLRLGADTFLLRREKQIPHKFIDEVYLIIHEMREAKRGIFGHYREAQKTSFSACIRVLIEPHQTAFFPMKTNNFIQPVASLGASSHKSGQK